MKDITNFDQFAHAQVKVIANQWKIIADSLEEDLPIEGIDKLIESLIDTPSDVTMDGIYGGLILMCRTLNDSLSFCYITGCPDEVKHEVIKRFLKVVYDSHNQTFVDANNKGIVIGQSMN